MSFFIFPFPAFLTLGEASKGLENLEIAIVIVKQLGNKHYELDISTKQARLDALFTPT